MSRRSLPETSSASACCGATSRMRSSSLRLSSTISLRFLRCRRAAGRLLRLVDVADARCVPEEVDAFAVIRLAFALDAGEHIVCHRIHIVGAEEDVCLRRYLRADVLASHVVAFDAVIGAAREERHAGSWSTTSHRFDNLFTRQLGLAQRERIAAIADTAIAVPFVAAHAIGALEDGLAGL